MARQVHTPFIPAGTRSDTNNPPTVILNFLSADVANQEEAEMIPGDKTLVIARDTGFGPDNVEVKSVPGPQGRSLDPNVVVDLNDTVLLGPFGKDYRQIGNKLFFAASVATIQFAVIRLP